MGEPPPPLPAWLRKTAALALMNRAARRSRDVAWHVDDVRSQLRAVDDPPLHVGPEGSACPAFVSTRPERVDWFVHAVLMLSGALQLWLRRARALRAGYAALKRLVTVVMNVPHHQRNDRDDVVQDLGPPGQLVAQSPLAAHAPPAGPPQFDGLALAA